MTMLAINVSWFLIKYWSLLPYLIRLFTIFRIMTLVTFDLLSRTWISQNLEILVNIKAENLYPLVLDYYSVSLTHFHCVTVTYGPANSLAQWPLIECQIWLSHTASRAMCWGFYLEIFYFSVKWIYLFSAIQFNNAWQWILQSQWCVLKSDQTAANSAKYSIYIYTVYSLCFEFLRPMML